MTRAIPGARFLRTIYAVVTAAALAGALKGQTITLSKSQFVEWSDSNDSIMAEDLPSWLSNHYNVQTFSLWDSPGSGAWLFRGSYTGATRLAIMADTGNVGVGTTSPSHNLHIYSNSAVYDSNLNAQLYIQNVYPTNSQGHASVILDKGSNTASAAFGFNAVGVQQWDVGILDNNNFQIRTLAAGGGNNNKVLIIEHGASANSLYINANGYVGIGTTNPIYPLSIKGTIGAGEVIVTNTSGWADYVLQPDYRLRQLPEVAAYIKEHHHLPEIPTAEVKEKGIGLGEMQAKLLAKVEELTLHMIQANERNNHLEQQNRELQERMSRLEASGLDPGLKPAADLR